MLKTILTAAVAAAALSAVTLPAAAHERSIDQRQAKQAQAIERGRQTGKITWREGRQLRKQQAEIARLEAKLRANDGRIDINEHRVLHRLLDVARKDIRAEKRDGQRRFSALPRFGK